MGRGRGGGGEYSKMPYATETGLGPGRVGRSLAHARLITLILELETCSSSFARKLSDSLTTNKSEKNETWTGVRENALPIRHVRFPNNTIILCVLFLTHF